MFEDVVLLCLIVLLDISYHVIVCFLFVLALSICTVQPLLVEQWTNGSMISMIQNSRSQEKTGRRIGLVPTKAKGCGLVDIVIFFHTVGQKTL